MKITEIEVGEIFVPLAKPFKTALRTVENVEDIVVRITTDTGAAGYGEAPPTAVITGDTKGSIRCAIEDFIRPALRRCSKDIRYLKSKSAKRAWPTWRASQASARP